MAYLPNPIVLHIGLHNGLLEVAVESEHMPVKPHPVRLVKIGHISCHVLGAEVVMRRRDVVRVHHPGLVHRVNSRLARQRVVGWLDVVLC